MARDVRVENALLRPLAVLPLFCLRTANLGGGGAATVKTRVCPPPPMPMSTTKEAMTENPSLLSDGSAISHKDYIFGDGKKEREGKEASLVIASSHRGIFRPCLAWISYKVELKLYV